MVRLVLSVVLAIAILAVALPLISARLADAPPAVEAPVPAVAVPDRIVREGALYRWRDEHGTIHIASEPPGGQIAAERIGIDRVVPDEGERDPASPAGPPSRLGAVGEVIDRVESTLEQLQERERAMDSLKRQL